MKLAVNLECQIDTATLARFFSPGVLSDLGSSSHSSLASRLFRQLNLHRFFDLDNTVGQFYDRLFSRLIRDYRFEYVFKNAIAEKRFLGVHNLNTAFMLTEFGAAGCKADAVIVNGTSHVYEIKTAMDDFTRLGSQLSAYARIFDYITVVTEERLFAAAERFLPVEVGILTLADRGYQFRVRGNYRAPASNKRNTKPEAVFDSLTRQEYLTILNNEFGICLKGLPNTKVYTEAKRLFSTLAPELAHDYMVGVLRLRSNALSLREHLDSLPCSLKAAALSLRLNRAQQEQFVSRLNSPVGAVLA
ncbi:sce7726 family protein [Pseudohongiella sp. SYSU M77423]|uniref:sce7726 family protein n=1 Tax=Pseudohongiella sp. SYSU M77423 TaxID=3042312 RepID=UPI0024801AAA|nr:sce7726 family protein [Pseudohongiella sp. SYSU M77423]MDH7942523.1 sce7726 family protein [Pseudohongiella sp. SYSU M77423]